METLFLGFSRCFALSPVILVPNILHSGKYLASEAVTIDIGGGRFLFGSV